MLTSNGSPKTRRLGAMLIRQKNEAATALSQAEAVDEKYHTATRGREATDDEYETMITSYFAPKKKKNQPSSTTATTATTSEVLKRERDEEADTATASASATTTTSSTTSRDNSSKRAKAGTVSPPTVVVPKGGVTSISSNDQNDATTQLLSSLTDDSWRHELADHFDKPSFRRLAAFVVAEQQSKQHVIYPPPAAIWTALNLCPLAQVKVVIVGQDPYHGPGQAHGLAFSVGPHHKPLPPSLRNVYKELGTDQGLVPRPTHGHLVRWARQGVLLLNTVLTVRQGQAHSHKKKGWEDVTSRILASLAGRPCVFLLWGKPAAALVANHAKLASKRNNPQHVHIVTSHPSPLGATKTASPFIGSRCFGRCNEALVELGLAPIDWNVDGPLPSEDATVLPP